MMAEPFVLQPLVISDIKGQSLLARTAYAAHADA